MNGDSGANGKAGPVEMAGAAKPRIIVEPLVVVGRDEDGRMCTFFNGVPPIVGVAMMEQQRIETIKEFKFDRDKTKIVGVGSIPNLGVLDSGRR